MSRDDSLRHLEHSERSPRCSTRFNGRDFSLRSKRRVFQGILQAVTSLSG
jgi:hypothetical protein